MPCFSSHLTWGGSSILPPCASIVQICRLGTMLVATRQVVAINGQDTSGWNGEQAAKLLRGRGGTEVRIKLARRTEGIPGDAHFMIVCAM